MQPIAKSKKEQPTSTHQHTNQNTPSKQAQETQHQETVHILPIPHQVQQVVLSHIQYPKQARRRGWQGKAAFQLDIRNQHIQQVTMLASTGYGILDRAAKEGLASLETLPLNNGRYALAVVFQID